MDDATENQPGVESSEPVKKKRGNPNFRKGERNQYYDKKENTMSEETTNSTNDSVGSGEKKAVPHDVFSDVRPNSTDLPLDGEVKVKDYATLQDQPAASGGSNGGGGGFGTPVEPLTSGNPMGSPSSDNMFMGGGQQTTNPGMGPINGPGMGGPQMAAPQEDIKTQAEHTVRMMLKGYEKAHAVGRYIAKMDEQELMSLHAAGKIDLDTELPLGRKTLKARDFFADYNESIDENIVVEEKFKNDITPPLVRICVKRNWLLNDEAAVLTMLGEDIITKASLLMGLKKTANLVLQTLQAIAINQNSVNTKGPINNQQPPADFVRPDDNAWREAPVDEAQVVG